MAEEKKFDDLLSKYYSPKEKQGLQEIAQTKEEVPKGQTPTAPTPVPSKDTNTKQPDLGKETTERIESIGKGQGNNHENKDMLAAYRDKKPSPAKEPSKEKTQDDMER
jgi:hypothetical protein